MLLIGTALVLFSRENIPLETTSLVVLVLLTAGFTLFPFEATGKSCCPAISSWVLATAHWVAVCGLMIVGQGLISTGALEPVGRFLARIFKRNAVLSVLMTLLITATLSAFINNTPIVVLMLPILIGVAVRTGSSPAGTLIPMGFASILGGMATTIGTSTNLLVVNVAADMGMDAFNMFDFLGPVLIAGSLAIIYLWLIAPRLIPQREPPMSRGVSRVYTAQIRIDPSSPVNGRTLAVAIVKAGNTINVETIERGAGVFINPLPDVRLRAGDRLTTSDTQDRLREYARLLGGTLFSGEHEVNEEHPLSAAGSQIAEVAITPASAAERRGGSAMRKLYVAATDLRLLAFNRFEGMRGTHLAGTGRGAACAPATCCWSSPTLENLAALKSRLDGIPGPRRQYQGAADPQGADRAWPTIIGVVAAGRAFRRSCPSRSAPCLAAWC